ncbi:MAG: inositol monophosphatase, partial [Euzebyales bacterium]|nr:inositol monophosphatase [Euzebyales bacterium]
MVSDPAGLLALAVAVAEEAGAVLLAGQGSAGRVEHKSSATDPVSEADRAAERLIMQRLLAARPDDGVLGEEGAERPGASGLRWVVDPLDGTVNYLYGRGDWAVSIACEDGRGGLVGAVCDPTRGEVFSAARGAGASREGRRLRVNDPVALEHALLATGFSYEAA